MRQFIVSVFLLVVGATALVLASDSTTSPNSPSTKVKSPRLVPLQPSHDDVTGARDSWVVRTADVTSDGVIGSTTTLDSKIDAHRISTELIDRSIGGQRIAEAEKFVLAWQQPGSTHSLNPNSRPKN